MVSQDPLQALLSWGISADSRFSSTSFFLKRRGSVLGKHNHVPHPTLSGSEHKKQLCPGGSPKSVAVERVTVSHKELATVLCLCLIVQPQ